MQCEKARALLQAQAYEDGEDAQVIAHLADCADCRAFEQRVGLLNELLDADEEAEPRPGFDTRFFARLEEVKAEQRKSAPFTGRWLRWVLAAVPAVAAAAAVVVMMASPGTEPTLEDDLALAMELEMIEDLDLMRELDDVEAFEVLAQLDAKEIDQMIQGVPQ